MLVGRGVDVQQVAVRTGFEQADTVIGGTDQVVLGTFQLQVVHVELLVHLAAMEEKLVVAVAEAKATVGGQLAVSAELTFALAKDL